MNDNANGYQGGFDTNNGPSTKSSPRTAALLIAVVPDDEVRFSALWSQLECLYDAEKFQSIVIGAPDWAKKENILQPFIQKAIESIPHLKDAEILIKYHVNDRYDVGLWCDSLKDTDGTVLNRYDDFVLINDSIWALEKNFTGVLDTLREKNLTMTSLNYSGKLDESYWLESVFRGFNKRGMKRYMEHACVPADHHFWCRRKKAKKKRKRCIVEKFEIAIATLFERNETMGLYSSDVPSSMIRRSYLHKFPTWVFHLGYWYTVLRPKGFPVVKVSNERFLNEAKLKAPDDFNTCTRYLDVSFLAPIQERVRVFGEQRVGA